jgi:quinol monooxygenase YgiN
MLLIYGTIRLAPERVDSARIAMRAMIEATRSEAGCLHYSYSEDVLDAGLVHVNELWSDRAALEAHFRAPHIATWRAAWAELGISGRKLTLYEVGEGSPV